TKENTNRSLTTTTKISPTPDPDPDPNAFPPLAINSQIFNNNKGVPITRDKTPTPMSNRATRALWVFDPKTS
ncbi:hypothetical protein H5410_005965, partial [Solanum commersonii]